MCNRMLHSITHATKTLQLLNHQRKAEDFTNFTIVICERKFPVHQCIIAAHSPVIKRALEALHFNQDRSPNILLDGLSPDCFAILLDFIYTCILDVSTENVDKLLATAESLEISSAIALCKEFKKKNLADFSMEDDELVDDDMTLQHQQIKIEVTEDDDAANSHSNVNIDITPDKVLGDQRALRGPSPSEDPLGGAKRGRKRVARFSCPVCNKVLTESRLVAHFRTHTGEKGAICRICNKAFANVYNLKIHEYIHTGEKPYKCSLCPRAYSDPSSLSKHKLWHAGVKRQSCNVCGKLFSTRAQVNEHMRTHTKERPFACQQCDKVFAYKCDLSRHMRAHSGNLHGPCKHCGRYFTHNGNYKAHLRSHDRKNRKKGSGNTETTDPDFVFTSEDGHMVELVGDDNQSHIVKVRELAELMASGHAIEVVIGEENMTESGEDTQRSHIEVANDREESLVIVDSPNGN